MVNVHHIRELLKAKLRRLEKLELQRAIKGPNTPAEILIEIEDLNLEISNLNDALSKIGTTENRDATNSLISLDTTKELINTNSTTDLSTHRSVVIYLHDHQLSNISQILITAAIKAFAAVLGIDPETIEIYGAFRGSLILSLGIPSDAIGTLTDLLNQDSEKLKTLTVRVKSEEKPAYEKQYQLTVSKIIFEALNGIREGWILKDDQYQRRLQSRIGPVNFAQNEKAKQLIKKAKLRNQFVLSLMGMGLTEVPPEIGTLTKLRTLSLAGNKLAFLPAEIGNLENLRSLNLRNNQFTSIPEVVGNLQSLRELDTRGNLITELPENLEKLISQKKDFIFQYDKDTLSRH